MKKRFPAIILALVLCMGLTVPSLAAEPEAVSSFTDVADDAWYAAPVAWAVKEGITNGTSDTSFSPGQTCSQAEILTFLWRAYGKPEWGVPPSMANVKASDYYYDSAAWACAAGMIDPDTFTPSDPCTRAQAVRFIWIVFRSLPAAASNFTDVDTSADYAKAVDWAVESGVTNGTTDTTFSPDKVCSRGEIVTFLYRAYNN